MLDLLNVAFGRDSAIGKSYYKTTISADRILNWEI